MDEAFFRAAAFGLPTAGSVGLCPYAPVWRVPTLGGDVVLVPSLKSMGANAALIKAPTAGESDGRPSRTNTAGRASDMG